MLETSKGRRLGYVEYAVLTFGFMIRSMCMRNRVEVVNKGGYGLEFLCRHTLSAPHDARDDAGVVICKFYCWKSRLCIKSSTGVMIVRPMEMYTTALQSA